MSLLLDALKRAEQEKLSKGPDRIGLAEAPQAANSPSSSLELQPVTPPPPAGVAMNRNDAAKAQTVFNAKTAPRAEDKSNRATLFAIAGAIGIVVIAAAGYVWYSIKLLTPPPIAAKMRPRPPPAPTPAPASSEPSSASKMEALMQPGAHANLPPLATLTAAAPKPAAATPAAAAPGAPAMNADQAAVLGLLKAAPPAPPAEPLRLERTAGSARVPAEVTTGYEALRTGNFDAARRNYAAAVAADPASLDAQLGLATVEARSGNRGAAVNHYRKALELDPRNGTAAAGMAALADSARPEMVEAQLRADLQRSPRSAALHFALGNLYVAQARWGQAQAAYFEAHRLDPANADILYNLAVSLDHLGQARLAADFYDRALDASRGQATQFDTAGVSRRVAELRP
jgi:tetratricopeptide (TPR) repeat protein